VRVREVPAADFESPTSTAQSTTAVFLTSYLCPFADLLLWDSRTVHCNTPALSQAHFFSLPEEERLQQAAAQPRDLIRLCSYVCMLPRSHATTEELRTKVIMFSNAVTVEYGLTLPSSIELYEYTFLNSSSIALINRFFSFNACLIVILLSFFLYNNHIDFILMCQ